MKTPQEVFGSLLMYGVGALVVAGLVWWFSGSVVDAIRAPVVQELGKATAANDSLAKDNQRLVEQNARLDQLLTNRATFEAGVNRRLDTMAKGLKLLKATNARVREWAETPIPPEVLQ